MSGYEGMNPALSDRLRAMIDASGGKLRITSGYRSAEEQTRLWTAALAKYGSESAARKWVAPPGKSNHNHGLAADLSGDLAWAHANAPRFGLVFPMSWEPWHIETIGARAKNGAEAYTTPPPGTPKKDGFNEKMAIMLDMLSGRTPEAGDEPVQDTEWQGKGIMDAKTIARTLYDAGFRGDGLSAMLAISQRESGYNPGAVGDVGLQDATWGPSVGLFQIRTMKSETGKGTPRDFHRLTGNPGEQAAAAFEISNGGANLTPWALNGSWKNRIDLPFAKAVASQVEREMTGKVPGGMRRF